MAEHVSRTFRWLAISLAVIGLVADLGSKYFVFRWIYNSTPGIEFKNRGNHEVVEGWFRITAEFEPQTPLSGGVIGQLQTLGTPVMPRVNHGALFGLGGQHRGDANFTFLIISIVAALGILFWMTRGSAANDRWLCLALGLILGGTLGNLFDRFVFGGVRDFLYFYKIDWPVFNIADCCLVVGACVLVLHAFLVPTPKADAVTPA
jgi:signal peptidase II